MCRLAWLLLSGPVMAALGCRSIESRPARPEQTGMSSNEPTTVQPPAASASSTAATRPQAPSFAFTKSKDDITGETRFDLALDACDIGAAVKLDGSELIVVRHSDCRLTPDAYAEAWRQLLTTAIDEFGFVGSKIHLAWGRIASPESDSMAPTMSRRLAGAVRNEPRWDAQRGTVSGDSINAFVLSQAQPSKIFPELVRVASSLGFAVETEHIEKVLVGTPEQWPGDEAGEADPQEKLPYDAQIVFVLTRPSDGAAEK